MAEAYTAPTQGINEILERLQTEDRERWRASLNKARSALLMAMRQYSGLVLGAGDAAGLRGKALDDSVGHAIDEAGLATMDAGVDQVLNMGPLFPSEQTEITRDLMYVPTQETYDKMDRKDRNASAAGLRPKRLRYTDEMVQRMGQDDAKRAMKNGMLVSPEMLLQRQTPVMSIRPAVTKVLPEIPEDFRISDQNDAIGRDEAALRRMYEAASNDMSAVTARDEFERGLNAFKDVEASVLPPKQPVPVHRTDPMARRAEVEAAFPGFAPGSASRSDLIDKELPGLSKKDDFDFLSSFDL